MKTLNTFSILFWLKLASAKNGKAPLYARITVNGKRAELSLKQKILIKDWDVKKNRLKGLSDDSKKVAINRHETTTQLILLSVLFQSSVTFTQTNNLEDHTKNKQYLREPQASVCYPVD